MIEHDPITPPPELVEQWSAEIYEQTACEQITCSQHIATQAARWGADQELEACCEWLEDHDCDDPQETAKHLRIARRPKPSSLKERALLALSQIEDQHLPADLAAEIRSALEQLDD
jgi:hypothetical protein